jgi:hypothetical protein
MRRILISTGILIGIAAMAALSQTAVIGGINYVASNFLFNSDNTNDIGASGANRPRDLWLGRNLSVGGTAAVTGHVTVEGVTSTGATGTGNLVFSAAPAFTGTTTAAALSMSGLLSTYNGVATVGNGVGALVAKTDLTAQSASIGSTLLYAVPAAGAGMYEVHCYVVVTQAATSSSTSPDCRLQWTDLDSSATAGFASFANTSTLNSLGAGSSNSGGGNAGSGSIRINAKASSNINFTTNGYASSGATAMQYAVHLKLLYFGN